MASSATSSDRPDVSTIGDDSANDPFISSASTGPSHFRFSTFDQELFDAGPGSSPQQAKRALEAHLAETDRRLDEAGKLGTALVNQRRDLAEQLREIEKLQAEAELNPELRQKLVDIEKEYNDLARESARVFLPKQSRPPNNETGTSSPFILESRSGRRSVSPSKFESHATGSPTKLSVPSRKMRNQASNRVHDIEFAAEISTSLIAQVRNLQNLLGERDEQVKDLRNDMSRLELDSEAFQQRLKILDESEHRYKEENWDLQTRLQEVAGQQREASDREKKLNQALQVANAAKASAQKELDEVKLSHSKLTEEHAAATKLHDIELGTAKRTIAMVEGERAAMQRKIDDLTLQNQELAKAVASAQRMRSQERESELASRHEDFELLEENITPEHSPPASPVKITPRHSMLEAETIKSSLQHAQRTIQSQRSQLHREKTEKLELKRIIQDLRDDLEKTRNDLTTGGGVPLARRGRKSEPKEPIKKPPRLLGSFRSSRQEVITDDPEWEDTHDLVPRSSSLNLAQVHAQQGEGDLNRSSFESIDDFETANEKSESAFESALERANETDDLPTGNESYSDTDGALTETEETPSRRFGNVGVIPNLGSGFARHGHRASIDSTASISTDEDTLPPQLRTPSVPATHRRYRRPSKGAYTNPRKASEELYQSSPAASFVSRNNSAAATPQAGQSLFAELQDFGSDEDSVGYTPGRRSLRSMTPGSTRRALSPPPPMPAMPRVMMVDSGMMTEPVEFAADAPDAAINGGSRASFLGVTEAVNRPRTMESVVQTSDFRSPPSWWKGAEGEEVPSRPPSTFSYSDAGAQYEDMDDRLSQFPAPPSLSPTASRSGPPSLLLSSPPGDKLDLHREVAVPPIPLFGMSPISVQQNVEPSIEPETLPLSLSMSAIAAESFEPVAEPQALPALLIMSGIVSEGLEPVEEPVIPPPALTMSTILAENLQPQEDFTSSLPSLTLSIIRSEDLEPVAEPATPPPALSMSLIVTEDLEPREEPARSTPDLALSHILGEHWEPKAEPMTPPPALSIVPIQTEVVDPIASPPSPSPVVTREMVVPAIPAQPKLSMSSVIAEHIEPVNEPVVLTPKPTLRLSTVQTQELLPKEVLVEETPAAILVYSSIATEAVDPVPSPPAIERKSLLEALPSLTPPSLVLSSIAGESVKPDIDAQPQFVFSSLEFVETQPITPRSPRRDGFIIPRDLESTFADASLSEKKSFAELLSRHKNKDATVTIIAEDHTRQSTPDSQLRETLEEPESRGPLNEISANADARLSRKYHGRTNDQGAQTSLTASTIDWLIKSGSQNGHVHEKKPSVSVGMSENAHAHAHADAAKEADLQRSVEPSTSSNSKGRLHNGVAIEHIAIHRPHTSMSVKSMNDAPTLLPSHQPITQNVRATSSGGPQTHGIMGPPLWPASAMKSRPRTPNQQPPPPLGSASGRATPTPRPIRAGSSQSNAEFYTPAKISGVSRQSSTSSFVSELDARFNIRGNDLGAVDPQGFSPNTDPRMIQAITQTMIGEFLWKYTRKAGRGELSEKRHRRYFWVHPYTRTIYWSEKDPTTAGRTELRAKSLPIEAVRVVTDDNPMPPGLYRKSLVIISPGRTIKFTCATGQRHETWFNALSYLLLRTTNLQHHSDAEDLVDHITRDDVDEFNPQSGRRSATGARLKAPSLSSYNSRMTRNDYHSDSISLEIPTLTPSSKAPAPGSKSGMGSLTTKIGGYLRPGGAKARSRNSNQTMLNETSEAHDSAEDLREMIERQDREADRLENVRMCCDGKHDVGTLPHVKRRSANIQVHSHPGPGPAHVHGQGQSATSTPVGTPRFKAAP